MSQQLQTEAQDKTQQRLARRESHPTAAPSLHGELHPMLQLQRLVGNRRVAQLIQATAGEGIVVPVVTAVVGEDGGQLGRGVAAAKGGAATGGGPPGRGRNALSFSF